VKRFRVVSSGWG